MGNKNKENPDNVVQPLDYIYVHTSTKLIDQLVISSMTHGMVDYPQFHDEEFDHHT